MLHDAQISEFRETKDCEYIFICLEKSIVLNYASEARRYPKNRAKKLSIEWVEVNRGAKAIGAVGFIGNDAVAIVGYFDDYDGNEDDVVSGIEWVSRFFMNMDGRSVMNVAMTARYRPEVFLRDISFVNYSSKIFTDFGGSLIAQGVYIAYFQRGVKIVGGGVAARITQGMVKEFVVRKGFEAAVKAAIMSATRPDVQPTRH